MTIDAAEARQRASDELQAGIGLPKCRQCGCMRETLETLQASATGAERPELAELATARLATMMPIRYACLGCEHCFPAAALNALAEVDQIDASMLTCAFEASGQSWPVVAGEYVATCTGADCPVAVSTLASTELAHELARRHPAGLCIVGKTETETLASTRSSRTSLPIQPFGT